MSQPEQQCVVLPIFYSSGRSTQSRVLWTYEPVLLSGFHPGSRWSSGYDLRRAVVNPPDQRTDLAFPLFEPQHCRSILFKKNSSQGFRSIQVEGGVTLLRVDVSFFASSIFFLFFEITGCRVLLRFHKPRERQTQ